MAIFKRTIEAFFNLSTELQDCCWERALVVTGGTLSQSLRLHLDEDAAANSRFVVRLGDYGPSELLRASCGEVANAVRHGGSLLVALLTARGQSELAAQVARNGVEAKGNIISPRSLERSSAHVERELVGVDWCFFLHAHGGRVAMQQELLPSELVADQIAADAPILRAALLRRDDVVELLARGAPLLLPAMELDKLDAEARPAIAAPAGPKRV